MPYSKSLLLIFIALALALIVPTGQAQTYYYYPDDNTGANASSPAGWYPWYTNTTGVRHQIQVPASALASLPPGSAVTSIGVFLGATTSAASATYTILQVRLGPAGTPALTSTFDTNLVPGTEVLVVDQPGAIIPSQTGNWFDFTFTVPYIYNGGDLIVDTQTQISGTVYHPSAVSTSVARCYNSAYTGQPTGTLSASSGTKVRFAAMQGNLWQQNQPGAGLTFNFNSASPPIITNLTVGQPALFVATSTSIGLPWELAVAISAPVPLGGGGVQLPGGQIVNLDLTDPSLAFLGFALGAASFPGTLTIPFAASQPLTLSAQTAHLDPLQAGGLSLSGVNQLIVQ